MLNDFATYLIGLLQEFLKRPPDEQLQHVVTYLQWAAGIIAAVIGLFLYLVRRASRYAIDFAKEREKLEAAIGYERKANSELSAEKAEIAAELAKHSVESVRARIARELSDDNTERATAEAEAFHEAEGPALAFVYKVLSDAALARVEDGDAAFEAARYHAMGWLAADPDEPAARAQLAAIDARLAPAEAAPTVGEPNIEDAEIAELRRRLQADAYDAGAVLALAAIEFRAGHYRIAALVYERALQILLREHGGESPDVMVTRISVGRCALWSGQLDKASKHVTILARHFDQTPGTDLETRLDFEMLRANFLNDFGSPAKAQAVLDRVLASLPAYAQEWRTTLSLRFMRAVALENQGKAAEAEGELRSLLPLQGKGIKHPDRLNTLGAIGSCLQEQGKAAEAETELRALLPLQEKVEGVEHPNTLTTRYVIACCMQDQGRAAEAEAELRALLPLEEKVQGIEHPSTLTTRYAIASCLQDQGKAADAEAELRALLPIYEKVKGLEHPYTLTSRYALASCLIDQGKATEAKEMLDTIVEQSPKVFGAHHRKHGVTHFEMGRCLDLLGEVAEAQRHLDLAASILEAAVLRQHPSRRKFDAYLASRAAKSAESPPSVEPALEIPA